MTNESDRAGGGGSRGGHRTAGGSGRSDRRELGSPDSHETVLKRSEVIIHGYVCFLNALANNGMG